jgi:hypothetical protein
MQKQRINNVTLVAWGLNTTHDSQFSTCRRLELLRTTPVAMFSWVNLRPAVLGVDSGNSPVPTR